MNNSETNQVSTPPEKSGAETAAKVLLESPSETKEVPEEPKKEEIKTDFKKDLERMKEMQNRVELAPDEMEKMRNNEPVLLDDGILLGIGFKSFDIQEILG